MADLLCLEKRGGVGRPTMTIKREAVDKRQVDFSDVRTGRRLPPVHPGEVLRDEFLSPLGIQRL